jgi:hypothetical protein
VLAVEDGPDSLKGCCPVYLGILLASFGQDATMPEAFSLCQLEPVPIPQGNNNDHHTGNNRDRQSSNGLGLVPVEELVQPIRCTGVSGHDRFVLQMAADILSQAVGRLISPGAVLLQGLHHDPVKVTPNGLAQQVRSAAATLRNVSRRVAERAKSRGGLGRLLFPDDSLHLDVAGVAKFFLAERRGASQ